MIEISKILLLIDNDTVTNWSKSFAKRKDITSWFESSYKAYKGKLTKEEEKRFIEFMENNFVSNSKQAIEYLRVNFQKTYSMSGMVNLLHNLGFVYKQSTLIPSKYDPEAQKEFKEEYEKLEKEIEEHYKEKKKIYIVVDNARYYRNKKVTEYTADSRIEMKFLPPYSPNLNLIERLWKLLRRKTINNQYYDTFDKFRNAVLGFFEKSENMKNIIGQFVGNKMHLLEAN